VIAVHLIHLVFQEVSVTTTGCTVRRVACEHCGETYIYQLRIAAKGTAHSIFFIGKAGKKKIAEARAQEKLRKRLAIDNEPPPCPACGHYQRVMIPILRKRLLRRAALTTFFLAIALFILWIVEEQLTSPFFTAATQFATALVICSVLGWITWILLHNFNHSAHRRTREVLGARCAAMPAEEFDALLAGQTPAVFMDEPA
jgi:hypothetical protein